MFKEARILLPPVLLVGFIGLPLAAGLIGCGGQEEGPVTAASSKYEVADEEPASPKPAASENVTDLVAEAAPPARAVVGDDVPTLPGKPAGDIPTPPRTPPLTADVGADPYQMPEGQDALLAFLEDLHRRRPQGLTQDELVADYRRIHQARRAAAEKLLDTSEEKQIRFTATQAKLDAMRALVRIGDPQAEKELHGFSRALMQGDDPDIAGLGRLMLFGLAIDDLVAGEVQDVQPIVAELKALVADSPSAPGVFMVASQAAVALQSTGHNEAALEAYRIVGQAYKGSDDEQMAREARSLLERAREVELGLPGKLRAVLMGEPDSAPPLMEALTTLLQEDAPGEYLLNVVSQLAQMLERTGHHAEAGRAYLLMEEAYKEHPEKMLAEFATRQAEYGRRRAALIGQPLVIEGVLADGSPLDWSKYRGKVVLVDFWATWCVPCLNEIPNIERVYEKFRDRGFEVIGVNLDEDLDTVREFLGVQSPPWPIVVSPDPEALGFKSPMAVKCGVDAIPFLILIDGEGKVNALHVGGPQLEEKLAELLGPVTEEKPAAQEKPVAKPEAQSQRDAEPELFFVALQQQAAASDDDIPDVNPYAPRPGLSAAELVDFIFDMQDKPKSIQDRPGFAEGIVEAADRILAAETTDKHRATAALAKFEVLHKKACLEDKQADEALAEFVAQMKDCQVPRIAAEVAFFELERKVIDSDPLPLDKIPGLLAEVSKYLADKKLSSRHLRLASSTVHVINRLEDPEEREKYFQEFGKRFAKSDSKDLARYGKKLAKKPGVEMPDLVGQTLELAGVTALGTEFNWKRYRGKVVLVDFWATWCGPCRRAMPQLKALYERLQQRGFDVVGISLDQDQQAVAKYLEENSVPWTNLVGEEATDLATRYGIRGIPMMILLDGQATVVAADHKLETLSKQAEKLLAGEKS
jgi:thiol-disulfide isomerase/thioredoxin